MREEGEPSLGPGVEDTGVSRPSFLVSGVDTLQGTTTDTPDVDVDALSILGRSTGTLELVYAQSEGLRWAGSPSSKERFANPSFRGELIPPLSISPSRTVKLDWASGSWALVRPIVRYWTATNRILDHRRTLQRMIVGVAG